MWIESLPSGRSRGVFRTPAGRKVTRTFDFAYEAEAWALEAEERARVAADTGANPGHHAPPVTVADRPGPARKHALTVAKHGERWLARRRGALTDATCSFYGTQLRAIAKAAIGKAAIEEVRRSAVEQWITDQVDAGVGRPTINARLKVARMIFRDGHSEGLCDRNPTDGIKYLPTDIRADRVLTKAEDAALLLAADAELQGMVLLALDAGLRWEEAAAIGADCFLGDFLVVRQVVERGTRSIRAYPKGHRSRVVPMTERLMTALEPLIAAAREARGEDGLLFTSGDAGRPLDYWNWRRDVYRPACAAAKLKPRPRFHDLRHTYGTRLAGAGVPRHEIAVLMGHADESTTAKYIHAAVDGRRLELVRAAL